MECRLIAGFLIVALLCILSPSVLAIYNEEGIPLSVVGQGSVQGDLLTYGSYGLTAPPVSCSFTLDKVPEYARFYTGVWGGTEQYHGWVEVRVNNQSPIRTTLYGKDDKNEDVYVASHGVYWVAHDVTDLLSPGSNTITVTTSRGEADNKMDGRVYAALAVIAEDKGTGPLTQYWIAEGNENLHGEGWAGTNPTRKESASVDLNNIDTNGISRANLTVLLLATGRGQPDYLLFNGRDFGQPATPAGDYLPGARDIGNERSFDADGGAGTDTRYVDMEIIDVTSLVKNQNTVEFQRGRDLNGDGVITTSGQKSEGEDYIHPVFTMLTIQKPGTQRLPDFSVDNLQVNNAFSGKEAQITGTIWNSGFKVKNPVDVVFLVDNVPVKTVSVNPNPSGRNDVTATWSAADGTHTISIEVKNSEDPDQSDNRVSKSVKIGSAPVLSVKIGTPYRAESTPAPTNKAPLTPLAAIAGLLITGCAMWKKNRNVFGFTLIGVLGIAIIASCILVIPTAAAASVTGYSIPLTLSNAGGSDAPSFDVTLYLDGEKTAVTTVSNGLAAGSSRDLVIPIYITPGTHKIRVTIDSAGTQTTGEGVYEFP
jgi:subtilase family serine protease